MTEKKTRTVKLKKTRSFKLIVRWDDAGDGRSSSLYCNGRVMVQVDRPPQGDWWISGSIPGLEAVFDRNKTFKRLDTCKRYVAAQLSKFGLGATKAVKNSGLL